MLFVPGGGEAYLSYNLAALSLMGFTFRVPLSVTTSGVGAFLPASLVSPSPGWSHDLLLFIGLAY